MRTLQLTQLPRGPLDVLRRVMSGRPYSDGLLLVCTQGKPAVLLLRFGTGDDAGTRVAADEIGPGLLDVLVVDRSRWRSLLCQNAACCPAEGHPLPECSTLERFSP